MKNLSFFRIQVLKFMKSTFINWGLFLFSHIYDIILSGRFLFQKLLTTTINENKIKTLNKIKINDKLLFSCSKN